MINNYTNTKGLDDEGEVKRELKLDSDWLEEPEKPQMVAPDAGAESQPERQKRKPSLGARNYRAVQCSTGKVLYAVQLMNESSIYGYYWQ